MWRKKKLAKKTDSKCNFLKLNRLHDLAQKLTAKKAAKTTTTHTIFNEDV